MKLKGLVLVIFSSVLFSCASRDKFNVDMPWLYDSNYDFGDPVKGEVKFVDLGGSFAHPYLEGVMVNIPRKPKFEYGEVNYEKYEIIEKTIE